MFPEDCAIAASLHIKNAIAKKTMLVRNFKLKFILLGNYLVVKDTSFVYSEYILFGYL